MSIYLEPDDYRDAYRDAQRNSRLFFEPFDEFERLAGNKVRDDLPDNMPRINDGSLAALLLETPMRVLAQMMTGNAIVKASIDPQSGEPTDPQPWLQELVNIIWSDKIIPHANTQADVFTKIQVALYRALRYGGQPIYTFYTVRGSYKGADFTLPYVRDVYTEPGKVSDQDSDYIFMDSYFTKLQIKRLIAAANELGEESPWDPVALQEILDSYVANEKDARNKNIQERDKGLKQDGIKFTTVFQRGVEAPIDTFHIDSAAQDGVKLVKQAVNKDPTGDMQIHFLYAYEDLENPYGKGQVEISGGTQNVLDYLTQADVLATQIGLEPPIEVKGDRSQTDLDSMIYARRQFWFTGNAQVDTIKTTNEIYPQIPNRYGLYKTQLLNAQGSTTADVSSESGAPGFSRTPAGVDAQTTRTNAHDNFLRQRVHGTWERVAKSMINLHMANMQGEELMRVSQEQAQRLTRAGLIDEDPATKEPSTQEIMTNWDDLRGHFEFDVDPDSSIVKDNDDQVERLTKVAEIIVQNPTLIQAIQQSGYDVKLGEVYKQIFTKLGLQDIEKIVVPLGPNEAMPGMPGQPGAQGDVPPEVEQMVTQVMAEFGVDQNAALAILHARSMQVPEDQIKAYVDAHPELLNNNPAGAQVTPTGAPNAPPAPPAAPPVAPAANPAVAAPFNLPLATTPGGG